MSVWAVAVSHTYESGDASPKAGAVCCSGGAVGFIECGKNEGGRAG